MPDSLNEFGLMLAGFLPNLLAAILVLVVGWLVALLISKLVENLLRRTTLDDRLARALQGGTPERIPVERWISLAVFWLIMLFVIVLFLQTLNVGGSRSRSMPAGPGADLYSADPGGGGAAAAGLDARHRPAHDDHPRAEFLGLHSPCYGNSPGRHPQPGHHWPDDWQRGLLAGDSCSSCRLCSMPSICRASWPGAGHGRTASWALPNILGAIVVLAIGYLVARIIRQIVTNLLASIGVDRLGERARRQHGPARAEPLGSSPRSSSC
jgi:hypothetical protein